jgi:deoxyhypusine synthase
MFDKITPVNLEQVTTYPLSQRRNKVRVNDFAKICTSKSTVRELVNSLPNILSGKDFQEVVQAIVAAHHRGKPVICGIGAHVIKCGLSPWLIELMQRKVLTAIAMNGAGSIHDFEIALIGETSEDVASGLVDGTFGMATETANLMNQALERDEVHTGQMGMGKALGKKLLDMNPPYVSHSILANAAELNVPVTVHIALGTDIIHMHSNKAGPLFGQASFTDFRLFAAIIKFISDGGVYLNIGSAVILPEVFQKAFTVAKNLGADLKDFVTVNFDMEQRYRPIQNVVVRPAIVGARGYAITGHHELMIPLLSCSVLQALDDTVTS